MTAKPSSVLSQKEAEIRAQQIRQVDYSFYFRLPESDPDYSGKVEAILEIYPSANQFSEQIFMDFAGGGGIKQLRLNGKAVKFTFDEVKIYIPTNEFSVGKNVLVVEFSHPYGKSGFGFHRTRDSADGEYYMYSDFEPYHANKAFPVFDQPDLKATYTVVADVPAKWEVISNVLESSISDVKGESNWRRWNFPTTARFSTYLFALIAGPFQKWNSSTSSGIPMRLFARKSLAHYFTRDVNHWFEVTNEGFKFFENAFGYPYPFGKYDQILTPDYNHGAMENVAAVTFTEVYVFRTDVTPIRVLRRAESIVHELAHMWFGNLVTMKWWDDLWLNESFATYVSNLAMSKFQDKIAPASVWQQFNARNKEWAYREDDYVTTHPIVGTATDTEEALANFDGVTYGKGASVLKQLVYFIGEEAFFSGLREYFQKFQFKNATRLDFFEALTKASKKDLLAWEKEWLKSSGTNSVQVQIKQKAGKIEELLLIQLPDEADRILRTHQTELGLYDLNDNNEIILRETISVTYSGKQTTIVQAQGKRTPSLIFPNFGDHDFVHVVLDDESLATLSKSLGKVADPFLRQMLWSTLWNMVRHATLPAQKFAEIALLNLESESDLAVLQKGLECLSGSMWYMDRSLHSTYFLKLEQFVTQRFQSATQGSPMQIYLFSQFVCVARSSPQLSTIRQWLSQEEAVPGLKMDQERRWAVITTLARFGVTDARDLIEKEILRDRNDKGEIASMQANASLPEVPNKQRWMRILLEEEPGCDTLSVERARALVAVFHDYDRPELTQFVADRYFGVIATMAAKYPEEFSTSFAAGMFPVEVSPQIDGRVAKLLETHPDLQAGVKRELRKKQQLHQRTAQARALSLQYSRSETK